jgi:Leucine-rich repeat (LRR) protein
MEQSPKKIYENFLDNNLDKHTAIDLLISIIENSDDDIERIKCVENLKKMGEKNDKIYKILENLLLADTNEKVRNTAIEAIRERFLYKALAPMKWVIEYESNYYCILNIVKTLVKINDLESKSILIDEIHKISKIKYLDKVKRIDNKKFKKSLKSVLKSKKFEFYSQNELAEIIINFKTISELTKKFYSVYFELDNALVIKLDLADVEYEVRGWKADYKNNIKNITEITGLSHLKYLTHLNISNNQLKSIQELIYLKNLTHLYLSNNLIKDFENIEYIKQIINLKYVDLAHNPIASYITSQDFENIEVTLAKPYFYDI